MNNKSFMNRVATPHAGVRMVPRLIVRNYVAFVDTTEPLAEGRYIRQCSVEYLR